MDIRPGIPPERRLQPTKGNGLQSGASLFILLITALRKGTAILKSRLQPERAAMVVCHSVRDIVPGSIPPEMKEILFFDPLKKMPALLYFDNIALRSRLKSNVHGEKLQ